MRVSELRAGNGYYFFGDMIQIVFIVAIKGMVVTVVNGYEIKSDEDRQMAIGAGFVIIDTSQGDYWLASKGRDVDHLDLAEVPGLVVDDVDEVVTTYIPWGSEDQRDVCDYYVRGWCWGSDCSGCCP